jgi:hypothetical protein
MQTQIKKIEAKTPIRNLGISVMITAITNKIQIKKKITIKIDNNSAVILFLPKLWMLYQKYF